MPMERVPDALRQKFFPCEDGYQLEYSKHICVREGYDCIVKFFKNCCGEFISSYALHCANFLTLCRIMEDRLEIHYVFSEELIIKDIEYIRCLDGGYSIVVALNSLNISVHPHCIALLHCNGVQLQLIRKLRLDQEITCLKVIADAESMVHIRSLLHPKMESWPHIVAVGTHHAHCFLFHFDQLERHQEIDAHVPVSAKLTDGLKPFHDGESFVYTFVDECTGNTRSKRLSRESVYVSCISFLERSRTVLLGFSFGGIISISLTRCPTIDPLVYPCSAPVGFITPLEPDDDPRTHLWFIVAYAATKAKPLQLCLYQVMFPDEESLPISERTWDKPIFAVKLVFPLHNSSRWISLQTLVRERTEIRSGDDSTRDSYKFGSDKDKSLVFFTYVANDRNGCTMKGGLFDLNAYYYKRLVQVAAHDGTAAQQCAFMSVIYPIPMHVKEEDFSLVKDAIVDPSYITRFISNVSDAEQMFYPSALEIFIVYVAGTKKCYQFTLPSLPNQLLSTICADLEVHIADPKSASTWLSALGFYGKATYSAKDHYGHLCSVLSVLISHQRAGSVVQFIKHCDSPELRHMVASWIWEEIDKASKKIHEAIAPLFARFSAPLSPAGKKSLAHVHDVFVAGVQIMRELLITGEREQDETKEYMTSLEAQRFAAENLRSYSTVIHQLMYSKILPVAEDREIRLAMEESLKERRSKISGGQLNVDKLVTRMRRRSPSEPIWHAEGPQWYPPALLNLLGPILLLNIPTKWKGQLLTFYLLDYASCKAEYLNDSDLVETTNIIDLVTKQMNGILSMNKDEVRNVYKMWAADCGKLVLVVSPKQSSPCLEEASAVLEAKRLMSIPRTLSAVEEKKLKSLLESVPLGYFRWQCYLARNRRYDEIVELPIPLNAENDESVLEYLQLLPAVKLLRCNFWPSVSRPSWPSSIKEAIEKFERERCSSHSSYENELPLLNRGKTPRPLLKLNSKASTLRECKEGALATVQPFNKTIPRSSEPSRTPSASSTDFDLSEDDEFFPRNIPINTLNNITDVLRTPKGRACAAAQAESQRKWIDRTPEGELKTAAPRSILKSAKLDRGTSPSRTRLQFDLPSSTTSSTAPSMSPVTIFESFEKYPNFNESLEYDGDEAGVFSISSKELQDRGSDSQDTDGVLQKSLEVQDEDEEEMRGYRQITVEVEEQDEEGTNGNVEDALEVFQDEDEEEMRGYHQITVEVEEQHEEGTNGNVEDSLEVYVEAQDEEEIVERRSSVIPDKDFDHERNNVCIAPEEQELRTFIERQEEDCEVENAGAVSVNTSIALTSALEVTHVKLVDYSFSNSTFESTRTSKTVKTLRLSAFANEESNLMENDDRHDVDFTGTECEKTIFTTNESSDHLDSVPAESKGNPSPLAYHNDTTPTYTEQESVVLCASSSQHSDSQSSNPSAATRQHYSKKSGRASVPSIPTRHSLRLRGRVVEPDLEEADGGDIQRSDVKVIRTPVRKRTRKESSTSEADYSIPHSARKSPARKRKTTDDCHSRVSNLETPSVTVGQDSGVDIDDTTFQRVLRTRTPSSSRQEVMATPVATTTRTYRKTSEHDKEANSNKQPNANNERSRTIRSRKLSTTDNEDHTSVAESSSSRRTPGRSIAKSDVSRSPSTTRRSSSRSKTLKELQGRYTIPEPLGGLDARSFFDMVTEQKESEVQNNRRRTLSDSGVTGVKAKSRKNKVWDTIAEVEEESVTRKTPRPRRSVSASFLEETPSMVTDEHRYLNPDLIHTPRSSRRKRQPRQISPIPE